MISSKKVVIEPTAGVNKAKIYPKIVENCKHSYLQCNNSNTVMSSGKTYLSTINSSQKVVIEPTAGVNQQKFA